MSRPASDYKPAPTLAVIERYLLTPAEQAAVRELRRAQRRAQRAILEICLAADSRRQRAGRS